ncbi:MAG: hypothetical protein ACOH2V_13975 [Candidatus Saccharimonadaceae bacterium]
MKIIGSTFLPFKGFTAINLFGIVFARKDCLPLSRRIINHETIHSHQIKDLWFVGFYIWYVCEWFVRLLYYRNLNKAYKSICFEKEAYDNDADIYYLESRKQFAFLNYIK